MHGRSDRELKALGSQRMGMSLAPKRESERHDISIDNSYMADFDSPDLAVEEMVMNLHQCHGYFRGLAERARWGKVSDLGTLDV